MRNHLNAIENTNIVSDDKMYLIKYQINFLIPENSLFSVRSYRYHSNRYPGLVLNKFYIFLREAGNSLKFLLPLMSSSHPLSIVYTGSIMESLLNGNSLHISPSILYEVQILMVLNPDNTSALVMKSLVIPFTIIEYFIAGRSSHPHRLGLPVVEPNSWPKFLIFAPVLSFNSVGNGPHPTLVQ